MSLAVPGREGDEGGAEVDRIILIEQSHIVSIDSPKIPLTPTIPGLSIYVTVCHLETSQCFANKNNTRTDTPFIS